MADKVINIRIEKLAEIKELFKKYPTIISWRMNEAVARSLVGLERSAKRLAPVNKQSGGGNLRQSIKSSMTGVASGKIEATANYAYYVHEGTRPHIIRARIKKGLANVRTGQYFGKIVHHPGTKANPFLELAYTAEFQNIQDEFAKVVDNLPIV